MATKKEINSPELVELRNKMNSGKVVLGRQVVMKLLRQKKVQKVYLASNCPAAIRSEMVQYGQLTQTPVVSLEFNNADLGIFCKKPFFISVLGITA